jgi:agmatinase
MARYGAMYGPDVTFLGIASCDLTDPKTYKNADAVIIGAPFDGGASYRSGARLGPSAIRVADYLPHDASRPHLALRADGLKELKVFDGGDVEMFSGDAEKSCKNLEAAVTQVASEKVVPIILGGDHTVTWPDVTGVANVHGFGKVAVIHFDAHADTGDITFGSLIGHGHPMRQLIESGAVKGNRFWQIGLRGYWPDEKVLKWMSEQQMRSYEMSEIEARGFNTVIDEVIGDSLKDCVGFFLSVDIDVVDPAGAPGTGTPEPGGLTSRQLLDAVRKLVSTLPLLGMDVVEVAPAYDHSDITAILANRVVLEALSALAAKKKYPDDPMKFNARPLLEDR